MIQTYSNLEKSMENKLPSNRKFGSLFTGVFIALTLFSIYKQDSGLTVIFFLIPAILFAIGSALNSEKLTPLNKLWFFIGQSMGKIVSPIVLGIIFFALITPIGLIGKLFNRDELKLKRPQKSSYWVSPVGSNSEPESFKNQF